MRIHRATRWLSRGGSNAKFIHDADAKSPLDTPSAEEFNKTPGNGPVDMLDKPSSSSSKPRSLRLEKRIFHNNISLSSTSTAVASKTLRGFVRYSRAAHQSFEDPDPGMDAQRPICVTFIPILFFSLVLSLILSARICVTFAIGFAFFLLDPIQNPVHHMQQRHDEGLDIAMKLLKKPKSPELPSTQTASDEEIDSDGVSTIELQPPHRKQSQIIILNFKIRYHLNSVVVAHLPLPPAERHQTLMKFAKKITNVAERASSDAGSVKSSSRNQSKTNKLLRAINDTCSTHLHSAPGSSIDEVTSLSSSNSPSTPKEIPQVFSVIMETCLATSRYIFSRTPVSRPNLSFYSGLGQSFKVRKSLFVIPLSQIVAMRKVSMLSLAGRLGRH
ncbi:hypothetical protein PGTUg99_002012 [Puccinia graminis f. sp. tritici]|uniref:Uncharacterized protein n=1 Tax=Puccinia graminis f. sp. tritici TaxID=56615 RepID=A0A5B0S482_PUCGR|nr:hypothetical protein PGTUg99_002012 [Puccinia graminis f. sp. tritici]